MVPHILPGPVYSSSSPAFNSSNQSYSSSVGDGGYHHSASGSYSKFGASQSFDQTKKSLDDELKELDSQLDSQLDSKMLSKVRTCSPYLKWLTAPDKHSLVVVSGRVALSKFLNLTIYIFSSNIYSFKKKLPLEQQNLFFALLLLYRFILCSCLVYGNI